MSFSTPELTRAELAEQYGRVLDEYRFQVELNWKRSQYFLVLNFGIVVAATGLMSSREMRGELVGALFAVGAFLCLVALWANRVQHRYYRRTREVKRMLEEQLGLGRLALTPTPGMQGTGAERGPLRLRYALQAILVALAAVDVGGAVLAAV